MSLRSIFCYRLAITTPFGLGDSAPPGPTQDRFSPRGRRAVGAEFKANGTNYTYHLIPREPRRLHIFACMIEQFARTYPYRKPSCQSFLPLWHPAQSSAGQAEINPMGPSTYSRLAGLVGRASYPYEGNNPVFFPLLLLHSRIHTAGIETHRISKFLLVLTFHYHLRSAIIIDVTLNADARHTPTRDQDSFLLLSYSLRLHIYLRRWNGHGLQGKLTPNLYGGRLRLYLSRTDYDTPQDCRLRARTPAPAPGPLALPT
ncbi:hypothetical protein F4604DRAFT_1923739 [Suillus subluteus]|nr:hypothetical protein F4604DRAFT_1923739 [Suillus subluteus]